MSKETKTIDKIIKNARQIEADMLFTEKSNFIFAKFWGYINSFLTILIIILSIISAAFIFKNINGISYYLISISNLMIIFFSIFQYYSNPSEKGIFSRSIARKYNLLRKEIEIFYTIEIYENSYEKNIEILKDFNKRKFSLDSQLPNIYGFIYKLAKRSIEKGEHSYNDLEE